MEQKNNKDILMWIVGAFLFSYFGWLNFEAINELIPVLSTWEPYAKLLVGTGGLFMLVKFGIKRLGK